MLAGLDILNLHAQGGMAEVYRARGRGSDGSEYFYAVKRILPEYTRDPEIKRMFIEESRIASLLIHPNVVRVYELATNDDEDLYIVMEFLEGKDLSEAIDEGQKKNKSLPVWFAIQIAREVCLALDYVTTKATDKNGKALGLIHRDVSPHNIFLCYDGQVKLTDFGVAKVQESSVKTQVGITKGKLGYMSPEQLMGTLLDFRSDLYNVGILLYEMIVGSPLFAGSSTAEFLQSMVRGLVPPISPHLQVPPELESLIRRALDRDRNRRPANAAEFLRELDVIAQRYNLSAQPGHVAHHLRELFGTPEVPRPTPPAVVHQQLKSLTGVPLSSASAEAALSPLVRARAAAGREDSLGGASLAAPNVYSAPPFGRGTAQAGPVPALDPVTNDDGKTLLRSADSPGRRGGSRTASLSGFGGSSPDLHLSDLEFVDAPLESPAPQIDDTPASISSVFDALDVTTQPLPRSGGASHSSSTVAHGNARPLQELGAVVPGDAGTNRSSTSPTLDLSGRGTGPLPAPTRPPTVQVGGASLGGKKKVVPLDVPRKR